MSSTNRIRKSPYRTHSQGIVVFRISGPKIHFSCQIRARDLQHLRNDPEIPIDASKRDKDAIKTQTRNCCICVKWRSTGLEVFTIANRLHITREILVSVSKMIKCKSKSTSYAQDLFGYRSTKICRSIK